MNDDLISREISFLLKMLKRQSMNPSWMWNILMIRILLLKKYLRTLSSKTDQDLPKQQNCYELP